MLLKNVCKFSKGLPIPRDKTNSNFEIPYLHYGDIYKIYNNKLDLQKENRNIIKVGSEFYNNKFQIDNDNIVMNLTSENYADLGKSIIIKNKFNEKFISGMETHLIKIISQEIIPEYLSLYFQSQKFSSIIQQYITGMKVFRVKPADILNIDLDLPSIDIQQHIVDIIGSIDDKIENNSKIISSVDKLMLLNFRKNYDLANNIKTYKMNLKDVIELKTGKKDANASLEKGHYPFFTCSEKDSKIDEYSFDQEAIIIAGNGNMSVKYYKGKFDAYQRTYIIKPNKYTCYLYLFYKTFINDISQGARGSVIKFLTRSMLEEIEVHILNDDKMNEFEIVNIERLNFIQKLKKENKSLEKTKALYLKKFFD